jgi:hypothetical protein
MLSPVLLVGAAVQVTATGLLALFIWRKGSEVAEPAVAFD